MKKPLVIIVAVIYNIERICAGGHKDQCTEREEDTDGSGKGYCY